MSMDHVPSPAPGDVSPHEILDVLLHALAENPGRVDLWMMRFQMLRVLGQKADFISAMREASADSTLRRDIDWRTVGHLWAELAPSESPPEGVRLRASDIPSPATKDEPGAERKERRFSDLAQRAAGAELDKLAQDYRALRSRPDFFTEFARRMREVLQRPTPLHHAEALQRMLGTQDRIFFKREDLRRTTPEAEVAAAHAHIATLLGKSLLITGNDVDEFSLALVEMAPRFGLKTTIVVRPDDFKDKVEHVARLRDLGANVEAIRSNALKSEDPREGALLLWARTNANSHLALSLGTGPHPYPRMISDFQMLLGYESELQLRAQTGGGRKRALVAAVHSEADSIGFVLPYLRRSDIEVFYAEPESAGRGGWKSSARLRAYNGARREHGWLRATGRITHFQIGDAHARHAQEQARQLEGIDISLEDARALALGMGLAQNDGNDQDILVLVS